MFNRKNVQEKLKNMMSGLEDNGKDLFDCVLVGCRLGLGIGLGWGLGFIGFRVRVRVYRS
jgi:hypothetical protein